MIQFNVNGSALVNTVGIVSTAWMTTQTNNFALGTTSVVTDDFVTVQNPGVLE